MTSCFFTDKPRITRFEMDQNDNRNCIVWCKVDSNPSSRITLLNMSDGNSRVLIERSGVTELKYSILSAVCVSGVRLKCMAENEVGKTGKFISLSYCCKSC